MSILGGVLVGLMASGVLYELIRLQMGRSPFQKAAPASPPEHVSEHVSQSAGSEPAEASGLEKATGTEQSATAENSTDPSWKPLYRRALGSDRFLDRWCARCGHQGTAWADGEGGIVRRCPWCLSERVRALRAECGDLPSAVDYLETMARGDLKRQSVEDRSGLTVEFDAFSRCARCDRLIERKDARYWLPAGVMSSPPYCVECYETLSATGEK